MAAVLVQSCPICGNNQFDSFLECEDFLVSHEIFNLQKCRACAFVLTNPQPDTEEIGKYYQSDAYISHTGGSKSTFDRVYTIVRSKMLRKKRLLVETSKGKTILDFGCGTGEFLYEMKKHGWNATGVEPSAIARKNAEEKGLIIKSKISELATERFDVITLWHVLEHLPEPNVYLTKLYEHLNSSGTLIIAVPNHESYDANHYKKNWAAYDVPRHLWHFNTLNMNELLKKNGFELESIKPMIFDSFYVSLLSEQHIQPNRIINSIKSFYIGFLSNIRARKSMNYSSLIFIAKKCD